MVAALIARNARNRLFRLLRNIVSWLSPKEKSHGPASRSTTSQFVSPRSCPHGVNVANPFVQKYVRSSCSKPKNMNARSANTNGPSENRNSSNLHPATLPISTRVTRNQFQLPRDPHPCLLTQYRYDPACLLFRPTPRSLFCPPVPVPLDRLSSRRHLSHRQHHLPQVPLATILVAVKRNACNQVDSSRKKKTLFLDKEKRFRFLKRKSGLIRLERPTIRTVPWLP